MNQMSMSYVMDGIVVLRWILACCRLMKDFISIIGKMFLLWSFKAGREVMIHGIIYQTLWKIGLIYKVKYIRYETDYQAL